MRTLILSAVVTAAVVLGGCKPCQWLASKCPSHDSTTIVTEVVRDTVTVHFPGDSVFITVPMETLEDLGLISEEEGRARVVIRFVHDTLYVDAKCDDDSLEAVIDNLKTTIENTKDRIVYQEKEVVVYRARTIHKIALVIFIVLVVVTGVWAYLKIRMGGVNAAIKKITNRLGDT